MSADLSHREDALPGKHLAEDPFYQNASSAFDFFVNEDPDNASQHGPDLERICSLLQKIHQDAPQGEKAVHDLFIQSYLQGIQKQPSHMSDIPEVARDVYRAVLNDRAHAEEIMRRYMQINGDSPHLWQHFYSRVQYDLGRISELAYEEGKRYKPGLA